jgi:hypothetical protein
MRNEIRIETDFGKPWAAVTIGDLREWHTLHVICKQCDRRAELNPLRLTRRYRPYALLVDVQSNLRCAGCDNGAGNVIEVERLPRNI